MDNMFLGGYLACSLIVVVEIGRCCLMVVEVSPSYPVKWWLLMAMAHIDAGALMLEPDYIVL